MEFGTVECSAFQLALLAVVCTATGAFVAFHFRVERLANRRAAIKTERAIRSVSQAVKEKANG